MITPSAGTRRSSWTISGLLASSILVQSDLSISIPVNMYNRPISILFFSHQVGGRENGGHRPQVKATSSLRGSTDGRPGSKYWRGIGSITVWFYPTSSSDMGLMMSPSLPIFSCSFLDSRDHLILQPLAGGPLKNGWQVKNGRICIIFMITFRPSIHE